VDESSAALVACPASRAAAASAARCLTSQEGEVVTGTVLWAVGRAVVVVT